MDIKGANLYQEMQAVARQARSIAGDMPAPTAVNNSSQSDFSALLKMALDNVNGLQKTSSELQTAVELGDPKVSLAQAMIAGNKASVAFEATVQVRNKLVEAAKEVGIDLKQTFAKEGKDLSRKAGRYAHARQFKRMRRAIKRQRTIVGRLQREVQRKASAIGQAVREALTETLTKAARIVDQSGQRKAADGQRAYSTRWRTRFHADGGQCSGVMADTVPR